MGGKRLFGYLGLCGLVALYFFGNSRKLRVYGASQWEASASTQEQDRGDSSQYKENTRVLNSASEYTNNSSASASASASPSASPSASASASSSPAESKDLSENKDYSSEYAAASSTSSHHNDSTADHINLSPSSSYHASTQNLSANNIYYINGTHAVVNHWYGWQPEPHAMDCSWVECSAKKHENCKFCRDSQEDYIEGVPGGNMSSLDPGEGWIPDVTMLRRMFLDGHDANGRPWPPPLPSELCHMVKSSDTTRKLLDEAQIVGAPISRTPETTDNKIFCFVYTVEGKHANSIRAQRETWAPGCDGYLAFSTKSDPRIPAISIPHLGREKYGNMWQKIRSIFQFVGKHYLSEFDWFYMGGDDLVVYPQNLKNYLGTMNSSETHYLGRRFKGKELGQEVGFNTGGGGYVLSRPTLQCLLDHLEDDVCKPSLRTAGEDVMTGICLEYACNITFEDTRDNQMRERFHHWMPDFEYSYKGYKKKFWYYDFIKHWGEILIGNKSCSSETVNFHYIKNPAMARYLFHYVQNIQSCNRSISSTL
ncbi:unnamed protein product [Cylindrotheca closterium]|uniref:N-acetylgalactosaminide beta-1,3-galactosyltransferase n=1 Tax=Cylindrotheca closterium TaxID=2856 RepID=A0AAD2CID8_9STRA|nr:unnamed protein product [Cylindrotheca closterium]